MKLKSRTLFPLIAANSPNEWHSQRRGSETEREKMKMIYKTMIIHFPSAFVLVSDDVRDCVRLVLVSPRLVENIFTTIAPKTELRP